MPAQLRVNLFENRFISFGTVASYRPAVLQGGTCSSDDAGLPLAASALARMAASLDPPTAVRALALLLLLLCGALSVWRWSTRRRSLPAGWSLRGSPPGATNAAGTSIAQLPCLTQGEACACGWAFMEFAGVVTLGRREAAGALCFLTLCSRGRAVISANGHEFPLLLQLMSVQRGFKPPKHLKL